MKGIIFLLVVLGAVCASPMHMSKRMTMHMTTDTEDASPFLDFVHGFLEGINVKGDIKKILECVKGGEGVIEKIITALNYLIHIDIKHLEDVIKGIMMLVDAVHEIYKIIQPCASSVEELKKLINAIINVNIIKIAWKLIRESVQFIHDIEDAIKSFTNQDFHQAGMDVGDILYRLFLEASTEVSDPVYDFIKGFLDGINEKGDINKILECLKEVEPIINEIIKALELISRFNIKDLIEGVKLLVKAVIELIHGLKPCTEGFQQLKKLLDALMHADIMKIITKIMSNPGPFLKDIMDCIENFKNGNYHDCGFDLGDILFRLFLNGAAKGGFPEFIKFVEGFFNGTGNGKDFNDIEDCLEKAPYIWEDIQEAIRNLQHIDWKRPEELVKALINIFNAFVKILEAVKPCSLVPDELRKMIEKIGSIDLQKLLNKIMLYSFQIISDLVLAIKQLEEKDFFSSGKSFGQILYLLVFKD